MPNFAALETTAYKTWTDDYRVKLGRLVEAVEKFVDPRAQERLGLRYVNKLPVPASGITGWKDQIVPELLGPLASQVLAEGVTSVQQQIEIDLDSGRQSLIRHGVMKDADTLQLEGYLLDIDVFTAQPTRYSVSEILQTADELNQAALSLFQLSLSKAYLLKLRGGATDGSSD
jgi:uncharacterized protein (TIGR04255 family)